MPEGLGVADVVDRVVVDRVRAVVRMVGGRGDHDTRAAVPAAAVDAIARRGGTRRVAHHVARVDAGIDAPLVFGMVRDRILDGPLIGEVLGRADQQVLLAQLLELERVAQRLESGHAQPARARR